MCKQHLFRCDLNRRSTPIQVAATTYQSISSYFKKERPDPLTRELYVGALLGTFLSYPKELWQSHDIGQTWFHYNKVTTLPFPDMGIKAKIFADMVTNAQAAWDQGIDFLDPQASDIHLLKGVEASKKDYRHGKFMTEKDFLSWMIMHNVTVCDLGAGTTQVAFKGVTTSRPSFPCKDLSTLSSELAKKKSRAAHNMHIRNSVYEGLQ